MYNPLQPFYEYGRPSHTSPFPFSSPPTYIMGNLEECHCVWWRANSPAVIQRYAGKEKGPTIASFTSLRQGLEIKQFSDRSTPPCKQNRVKLPCLVHRRCGRISFHKARGVLLQGKILTNTLKTRIIGDDGRELLFPKPPDHGFVLLEARPCRTCRCKTLSCTGIQAHVCRGVAGP